ncbi:hypothetical protein M8J76_008534 [Diaphorina citri]|nr:hypothetical protein M8J76_008534 [Diaphorina citri]KAI5731105.1 hypothetical protein M8J77_004750 [Diaphorina citri]
MLPRFSLRRLLIALVLGCVIFKLWPVTLFDHKVTHKTLLPNVALEEINQKRGEYLRNSKLEDPEYSEGDDSYVETDFSFEEKYWFMKNGTRKPTPAQINPRTNRRDSKLWPKEDPGQDRIVNQLMYVPNNYDSKNVKKILLFNALTSWNVKLGSNEKILNRYGHYISWSVHITRNT